MSTVTITNEPATASFVVTTSGSPSTNVGVTNEPDHHYCNLSHEQMRERARISWTATVTDKIYQFCAANAISCHALPSPALSHELMTYIGFMTSDETVFENALSKTISYIKRYITVDNMKGLLEEQSITGKNGSDWNCRFRVWPTVWKSSEYRVSESGFAAPVGADMTWMATRRCPARSAEACVSAAVAFLRKKASGNAGSAPMTPATPPSTPTASANAPVANAVATVKEVMSPFHVKFADMLRAGNPSSTQAQLNDYLNSCEGFDKIRDIFHRSIANEAAIQEYSRELAAKEAQIASLVKLSSFRANETQAAEQAKNAEIAALHERNAALAKYVKECESSIKSLDEVTKLYNDVRAQVEPLHKSLSSEQGVVKGLRNRLEVLEGENRQLKANLGAEKPAAPSSSSFSAGLLPKWTGSILSRASPDHHNTNASTLKEPTSVTTTSPAPPIQMSFVPSPAPFATNTAAASSSAPASPISLDFSPIKSPGAFPRAATPKVHFVDSGMQSSSNNYGNISGGGSDAGNGTGGSYYGGSEYEAVSKEVAEMDRTLADLGVEV